MRLIHLAALCGVLAGCSTITRGTTSQMTVTTTPPGAAVRTSLSHSCQSPCTFTVSRKDEFIVTASMPGYRDASTPVKTRLAGSGAAGFAGNVLIGGVVGMGVDAATGATLEHYPSPVALVLEPNAAPTAAKPSRSPAKKPRPLAFKPETAPAS